MNKIISYSLWGNNPKYIVGAKENIELAKEFFPEWKIHLYLSDKTEFEYDSSNLEIKYRTQMNHQDGCFWRFESCDSDDIVIVRDLDDRLSLRHRFVVDEWLNSDKDIHIIRDHPNHVSTFPILAGLFGVRRGIFRGINDLISRWPNKSNYTTDQIFLKNNFYTNKFVNSFFIHDHYYNNLGIEKKINLERKNYEFLGDTFDENDIRVESYWKIIKEYDEKN
jgi:hypothetical protein